MLYLCKAKLGWEIAKSDFPIITFRIRALNDFAYVKETLSFRLFAIILITDLSIPMEPGGRT